MKFSELTLPMISEVMGFEIDQLEKFAKNSSRNFQPTALEVVGNKIREIDRPYRAAKRRYRSLHDFFMANFNFHPAAHGGITSRSAITSAKSHAGKHNIITRDAENCFPSISTEKLNSRLIEIGFRVEVARTLSMLFTVHGRVPQGSPLSTDAVNFYFVKADQNTASEAGRHQFTYTRNCDDLILSTDDKTKISIAERLLERQIRAAGLNVNANKRREIGLQKSNRIRFVHNFDVSCSSGLKLCPDHENKARMLADTYVRAARTVGHRSIVDLAHKRNSLQGWINHSRQVKSRITKHLERQLRSGDRYVKRRLHDIGLGHMYPKWWIEGGEKKRLTNLVNTWSQRQTPSINP